MVSPTRIPRNPLLVNASRRFANGVIVTMGTGSPVEEGLIETLVCPGGNVTDTAALCLNQYTDDLGHTELSFDGAPFDD
jgi:hypothetical protein